MIRTIQDTSLTNIANAIRSKNGSSATYKPSEMSAAITALDYGKKVYGTFIQVSSGSLSYDSQSSYGDIVIPTSGRYYVTCGGYINNAKTFYQAAGTSSFVEQTNNFSYGTGTCFTEIMDLNAGDKFKFTASSNIGHAYVNVVIIKLENV